MDFYHVNEETPLIPSLIIPSSPRSEGDSLLSPTLYESTGTAPNSRASSQQSFATNSARSNQTEFQLSVDKVSFIYSPKSSGDQSYTQFHSPTSVGHDDELSILDPYFDVTTSRLRTAYDEAGPDEDDCLSYAAFRVALEGMGIRCTDDTAFLKLVASIDRENSLHVSFHQFNAAVHKLKLVHLFDEGTVSRMVPPGYISAALTVSDFSNTRLQQFTVKRTELSEYFTAKRPPWVSVRWINMNGRDSLNLKRLAIKYRLHPLAVEDTLEMHERPKFDRYEGHLFLVFPVLRMEMLHGNSVFSIKKKRSRSRSVTNLLKIDGNSSFRRGGNSVMNAADPESSEDPFKLWIEHVAIFVVGNNTVITVKDGDLSNIWQELNRRLNVPYSKLRHNDAKFLIYAVLDVIADQVTNVVDSITENLMELEDELEQRRHHFDIARLRFLKNELFRLPRLLKPAREVLKNLIESKDFDDAVTAYIRDVHDHVVQVLDDIELQLQMCRLLTEDYRDAKANQMNYVIYTLTIVTTVFLPAQFLTGVYGMNFDNMPELHERYGYAMFWLLVLSIACGLQFYFRHKKWI
ncbi:Magnesium and cobalt transporter cora, partial [Globisporangium splendens]